MSEINTMSRDDWSNWLRNALIFSVVIPVLITFLTSLQGNLDIKVALGVATQALITALIDLLVKYKSGETTRKE